MIRPLLAVALTLCGTVHADELSEWASDRLDASIAEYNLAGVTAAIAIHGEIVWSGAAGLADRENGIACTPDTVHRIASISKPMTATAVMQLVAAGKIDLEAPLQRYVPQFPESDKGVIRIQHLLTHTSGIRHYFGDENRPMTHYDSFADALTLFMNDRIPFEPGARYRYTTYGYTTLGAVIEAVSGQTYADYMREHVWIPADMTSTSLEVKGIPVENKMRLYRYGKEKAIEADDETDLSVKYPGGGIQSTASDLVRFAMAFEAGTLLDEKHREMMFNAPDVPRRPFLYGYGWIYDENDTMGRFLRHDGGQAGTSTNLLILRDHRIAVAVLANLYGVGGPVQQLTVEMAHKALEAMPTAEN